MILNNMIEFLIFYYLFSVLFMIGLLLGGKASIFVWILFIVFSPILFPYVLGLTAGEIEDL